MTCNTAYLPFNTKRQSMICKNFNLIPMLLKSRFPIFFKEILICRNILKFTFLDHKFTGIPDWESKLSFKVVQLTNGPNTSRKLTILIQLFAFWSKLFLLSPAINSETVISMHSGLSAFRKS